MPARREGRLWPGLYAPGLMVCQYGKVYTTSPVMISQAPNQWMTFIDDLYHWDGRTWVYLRSSRQMFHRGSADIFDEATRSDAHDWRLQQRHVRQRKLDVRRVHGQLLKVRQRLLLVRDDLVEHDLDHDLVDVDGLANICRSARSTPDDWQSLLGTDGGRPSQAARSMSRMASVRGPAFGHSQIRSGMSTPAGARSTLGSAGDPGRRAAGHIIARSLDDHHERG